MKLSANPDEICSVLQTVAKRIISSSTTVSQNRIANNTKKWIDGLDAAAKKIDGETYYLASFFNDNQTTDETSIILELFSELLSKKAA